jgi:6-pyruvoyltetrahydropterin/6-carboxytetrahydropterin synthase
MILTLETSWSSAHFYKNPKWNDEQNLAQFGRCFNEFGHGHDYKLEVSFSGSNLESLREKLSQVIFELREKLDHQHLNFAIPEFKSQIPTTENLAKFCQNEIERALAEKNIAAHITQLKLFERPDLWTEIAPA